MVATVNSHNPFVGFGKVLTSPTINMPNGTNSAIVVFLSSTNELSGDNPLFRSGTGLGQNLPCSVITDNMGNTYVRIASINNNSSLINPLAYMEVWAAIVNTPITKPIQLIVTFPATTIVSGDIVVLTPGNPANQLTFDNSLSALANVNSDFVNIGLASTAPLSDGLTPSANELVLMAVNYVFTNQPQTTNPTAPLVAGLSPTSLLDNVVNIGQYQSNVTNNIPNFIGVGLSVLQQTFGPGIANMVANITTQGQSVASAVALGIGIQEVPIGQGIQSTVNAPMINSPVSPENVAFVPTLTPGLTVIKLPVGT